MTGSTTVRQAVSRIETLKVTQSTSSHFWTSFALSSANLREVFISWPLNIDKLELINHYLAHIRSTQLKRIFIEYPNYGRADAIPPLNYLISSFPNLEELAFIGFCRTLMITEPELPKNFPKNLTRFDVPFYDVPDTLLAILPSSITDLHIMIRESPKIAVAGAQNANEETNATSKPPLRLPLSLTRLKLIIGGETNRIYEAIPSTVTELAISSRRQLQLDPAWQHLPVALSHFSCSNLIITEKLALLLPRRLLSLNLKCMNLRLFSEFLRALPTSLRYLSLLPLDGYIADITLQKLTEVLHALPPKLTGLAINLRREIGHLNLPTLSLALPEESVIGLINNIENRKLHKTSKEEEESGESSKTENLRVTFSSNGAKPEGNDLLQGYKSLLNASRELKWIVPERFEKVKYVVTLSLDSLKNTPPTTDYLLIGPPKDNIHLEVPPSDVSRWEKAIEKIKRLPKLNRLYISHSHRILKGIINGMISPLTWLEMPLTMVASNGLIFPSTLLTLKFSLSDAEGYGCISPDELIRILPKSLTEIDFGRYSGASYEFPMNSLSATLPNLIEFSARLPESVVSLDSLMHLPEHLTKLNLSVDSTLSFLPNVDFASALPRSIRVICIDFMSTQAFNDDYLIYNSEFFQALPKGIETFVFKGKDLLAARAAFLHQKQRQ